ncbi:MAG: cytochrome-c peroxidase, partial [Limisphaerales bacterium]
MKKNIYWVFCSIAILLEVALCSFAAQSTPSAAEVRAKAKTFLQPLPEKMPGAEKDLPAQIELGQKL